MRLAELPTDEDELLNAYATQDPDSRWRLHDDPPHATFDRPGMLALIRLCLLLDRPVRSILTAELVWTLARRLAELEDRTPT